MTLRIALVGGPMYDHLYPVFDEFDVEVIVHADHPTLNRRVAQMLAAGERIDLLSTHSKYAPSQAHWLQPLDSLIGVDSDLLLDSLAPLAVDLCRYNGQLLTLPRLIDVRIMWLRKNQVDVVPTTWQEIIDSPLRFGFPGRESGLFGTFFEMVIGAGGSIFDQDQRPCFISEHSIRAIEMLTSLATKLPTDLPNWHYDQVDDALLRGVVDASGAWPGAWGQILTSGQGDLLQPFRYPSGLQRWVSYAGCHAWGIPATAGDLDAAVTLLRYLMSADVHARDAQSGSMCANVQALSKVEPVNETDRQRLLITRDTINQAMITYPSHVRFPEVEDAGWMLINEAIRGLKSPQDVVESLQSIAQSVFA